MAREILVETKQFTLTQALLNKVRYVAGNLPDEQPIVDLAAWAHHPSKSFPGGRYADAKPAPQEWLDVMEQLTRQERREINGILNAVLRARKKQSYELDLKQQKAIEAFGSLNKAINTIGNLRAASEMGVLAWLVGISEKRELFLKLAFKQEQSIEDKTL